MSTAAIRVAYYMDDPGNPYQRLFYRALEPYGVKVVPGLLISDDRLRELADRVDVIHIHWPEYSWRIRGDRLSAQLRLIAGLGRFLRLARRLGLRVWWTAHNLVPHEGNRLVNYVGYRTVASHADLVLAHSDFAAARMKRLYGVRRVVVVPIGNFDGCYPVPRARLDTLRELGLDPDLPVVSCLGAIRRYKGIKTGLDAVAALGGRVQLVVAGAMNADVDIRDLWPTATPPWLRLLPHRLSDQQFADLAEASDAILLPYRRATTSAVLLTAWTLGRGVVASDLPCFADELTAHPGAGTLAAVGDAHEFTAAIMRYLAIPRDVRTMAARTAADSHNWSLCVRPLADELALIGRSSFPQRELQARA